MPKPEPHFDQDYADEILTQYEHIKILCKEARTETEVFNESDIKKAISRLNSGKSADESGIQTEHLKAAGCHILPLLVALFHEIVSKGEVPDCFKSGILTPVHKKDKDPTSVDTITGA